MSADARIIMEELTDELRAAHLKATVLLAVGAWLLDDGVAGGARTSLSAAGARLASLSVDGVAGRRVLSGEKSIDWWRPQALEVRAAISSTMDAVGGSMPSPSRLWDEVVTPTAAGVVAGVKSSASSFAELVPWISAAAIALVLGYLVFSFRGLRR